MAISPHIPAQPDEPRVPGVDLERVWIGVTGEILAREIGPVERLAARALRSPGLARALVATPSLVVSWIVATVVVLCIGVVASQQTGTPWVSLISPALAGAGIAYAYGPGIDPAFELSQSLAVSHRLVLLTRGLSVFGLNALLGVIASLVAEGASGVTFGWLVPMTAVSALALAAATVSRSANVGVAIALGAWSIVVLGKAYPERYMAAAVDPGLLTPVYLAITIGCIALALFATSGHRNEVLRWQ
jgi:hypothetical protein